MFLDRRQALGITCFGVFGLGHAVSAQAEVTAARDHFAGRTVRVIIPAAPGAGTDRSARHFISAVQALLPQTRFRIENNERAGGQVGASELWRSAPDGMTVGFPLNNLFYGDLLQREQLDFRFSEFGFIGSLTRGHRVVLLRNGAATTTVEELLSGQSIVLKSARAATSSHYFEALLMNALTGSRIRPVPGYAGGARNMAVITGEVDCQIGTIEAVQPIIDAGAGRIAFRLSSAPLPAGHEDVPRLRDHLFDDSQDWAVDILDAAASLGRPFSGPPGMDGQAMRHWQALFRAVVDDAAYRASALSQEGVAIDPSSGEDIAALLASMSRHGDALYSELETLLACGQLRAGSVDAICQ